MLNDVLYFGLICAGVGALLRLMYWAIEVEYGKPSEWAERMFEKTGNTDYLELYNQWKERGQ
ncbi:MAG: hypothetical protein [Bacteriophage sp.]|nr:MAG: hypothetical protein [Bacteriophage sp.]